MGCSWCCWRALDKGSFTDDRFPVGFYIFSIEEVIFFQLRRGKDQSLVAKTNWHLISAREKHHAGSGDD